MMTTDELATAVLAMVRKRDHVSFAELAREWPEHFRDGPLEIRSSVAPNLVIWVGLSEAGADALEQMKNRTVAYEPASLAAGLSHRRLHAQLSASEGKNPQPRYTATGGRIGCQQFCVRSNVAGFSRSGLYDTRACSEERRCLPLRRSPPLQLAH
jgi:hypothetical protein